MLAIFENRYEILLRVLNGLAESGKPVLKRAEKAVELVVAAIEELKQFMQTHEFSDVMEEVEYYKNTLPFFQSLFIYYAGVFNIETKQAEWCKKGRENLIKKEQKRIRSFLNEHKVFVTYWKLGKSYQDTLLFLRKYDVEQRWQLLEMYALGIDENYCTRHSLLLSTVMAYEKLHQYLEEALVPEATDIAISNLLFDEDMAWQGSITALGELILGLYASRVVKNPKIPLVKFTRYICKMFGVEPFNIHKVKEELRLRKKGRTPFYDTTRINLMRFWDEEDLNAL